MAKLIIPHGNAQEKAVFEKFGIRLIEALSPEEFEKVAAAYISTHNVLNLATCRDNEPRCTTLEYFNNGLTVYIMSEGGSKILSIQKNPRVSFTINDPYAPEKDYLSASGLQVWGSASIFKKHDDPARAREVQKYFRNSRAVAEQGLEQMVNLVNFNIITIEPHKIRYLDLRKGYRNVVWEKEEQAR